MIDLYVVAMFNRKRFFLVFCKFEKNHNSKMNPLIYILEERCSGLTCRHERTNGDRKLLKVPCPLSSSDEQVWQNKCGNPSTATELNL